MNLRTSCFNSAVFRSDAKRLWWVPALHTLAVFLMCLLPFYITYSDTDRLFTGININEAYENSVLLSASPVPYLILAVLTVGLSVLLFSYLNSKSAVAAMHALPVKRKTLYITHIVFGLLALIIPILINGGILGFMRSNPNIAQAVSGGHIGTWIYTQIAYVCIGFAFSVLIGIFTGNSVAHFVFTYIFALLPLFVEYALKYIMNINLYGFVMDDSSLAVLNVLYFSVAKLTQPAPFFIYLGYALVFFVLGYLVYKIRNLENSSEVVAFPKLKPVFVFGVAICSGILGYFYLSELLNLDSLFLSLPFGLLGLIIANMLAKKSFTLKGILKPTAVLVIAISALFCLFHFDITGFEKRVPDIAKIESVSVTRHMPEAQRFINATDGRRLGPKDVYVPNLTKQQDIENVLRFHSHKTIEHTEDGPNTDFLYINYQLKNGKTLLRRYIVDYDDDKDYLKPIMESAENKQERFPILQNAEENVSSVVVEDIRLGKPFNSYFLEKTDDTEIANRLISALKADLQQVTYEEFISGTVMPTSITVNYELPLVFEGTNVLASDVEGPHTYSDSDIYYVRPSYKNTIALLTELGFYDTLPNAADYSSVDVWYNSEYNRSTSAKPDLTITDPVQIEEIYRYVTTTQPNLKRNILHDDVNDGSIVIVNLDFKSETHPEFTLTWSKDDAGMPAALKNLFH